MLFAPTGVKEGFVAKLLPGSTLDIALQPGEVEVLPWRWGGRLATLAWRCESCKLTVAQDGT